MYSDGIENTFLLFSLDIKSKHHLRAVFDGFTPAFCCLLGDRGRQGDSSTFFPVLQPSKRKNEVNELDFS